MGHRSMPTGLSEGTMAKLTHTHRRVFEDVLELLTVNIFRYLNLEFDGESWFWPAKAHVNNRKVLKSLIWQKKKKKDSDITTWIHAVRPGQWKEKANWKQSKYIYFSVSLISFGCSFFFFFPVSMTVVMTRNRWTALGSDGTCRTLARHLRLLDSYEALRWGRGGRSDGMLHPATCDLLSVWDQWRCWR